MMSHKHGPNHEETVNKVMTEMVGPGAEICTHFCPDMYFFADFGE